MRETYSIPKTAMLKIYRINNNVNTDNLVNYLEHDFRYSKASVKKELQITHKITVSLFTQPNNNIPDWVGLLSGYADWQKCPSGFLKYNLVSLFSVIRNSVIKETFAVCYGSGIQDIGDKIDDVFGISVLERVLTLT